MSAEIFSELAILASPGCWANFIGAYYWLYQRGAGGLKAWYPRMGLTVPELNSSGAVDEDGAFFWVCFLLLAHFPLLHLSYWFSFSFSYLSFVFPMCGEFLVVCAEDDMAARLITRAGTLTVALCSGANSAGRMPGVDTS